jgi:nucleoside-diphosphate-sugar epimerase
MGYAARAVARRLRGTSWRVVGTTQSPNKLEKLQEAGFEMILFDGMHPIEEEYFTEADHWLITAPPAAFGDPVLFANNAAVARHATSRRWIGYISSTAVYGDQGGAWVDESVMPVPTSDRGRERLAVERAWRGLVKHDAPVHIFRAAGIYGPGRNALLDVIRGTARRIGAPGHVMNRIHVEDLARAVLSSIRTPDPGAIYNVADDEPAAQERVVAYAARILRRNPPELESIERVEMAAALKSFYTESKRVSNERMKNELNVHLAYPSYREGLDALAKTINA